MARPPNPDVHEALLEAARAEFGRRGLDGARVEDITRRAGVSKGAFYLHFRTKEEAFRLLLQRFLGALEEQAFRRQDGQECFAREMGPLAASDPAIVRKAIEMECVWDAEMLEVLWRNRHILAAADVASSPVTARMLDTFRRKMSALVTANFSAKKAAGQLRPELDPEAAADVVVGAYEAFARRMASLPDKPDLAGWARAVLHLVYFGALEPAPPGAAPAPETDPQVIHRSTP